MPEEEWCPMLPEDGCAGKGNLSLDSPDSFFSLGESMSFIFRPSPSRSVSGSPLPAPEWNKEDLVEDEEDEECFLDNDDELGWREWGKEWEKDWLLLELPSRLRSLEEECEEWEGYEGFLWMLGPGSDPVAIGEVMACKRPIAVSVVETAWEEPEDEREGERSEDLRFFLWGGPEPWWSKERLLSM